MDYTDKIEKAVDNMIDTWDVDTLINFAIKDRLEYYLESASKEEVNELLKEFASNTMF